MNAIAWIGIAIAGAAILTVAIRRFHDWLFSPVEDERLEELMEEAAAGKPRVFGNEARFPLESGPYWWDTHPEQGGNMHDDLEALEGAIEKEYPQHPATVEPVREHIEQFFAYGHLPSNLQEISRPFAEQAARILELPRNPERTVALRKLLESKDAAVRAALAG